MYDKNTNYKCTIKCYRKNNLCNIVLFYKKNHNTYLSNTCWYSHQHSLYIHLNNFHAVIFSLVQTKTLRNSFFSFHINSEIQRKTRQFFSFLTRSLCADSECTECGVKPHLIGPSSLSVPSHFHKHYLFTLDSSYYLLYLTGFIWGGTFQLKLFMPACLDIFKIDAILKVNGSFQDLPTQVDNSN